MKIRVNQVLAGLIPASNTKEDVLEATSCLRYFAIKVFINDLPEEEQFLATTAANHYKVTGGTLDKDIFDSVVRKSHLTDEQRVHNLILFSNIQKEYVPLSKYTFFVDSFIEQKEAEWIADIQTLSMIALEKGYTDPKTKLIYSGAQGCKQLLSKITYENPYSKVNQDYPEGNIRDDSVEVIEEYEDKKNGIVGVHECFTGFSIIDDATGGGKRGDLILIGAYTGEGKSIMLTNIAHELCTNQGKNGVIVTVETPRKVYRRRVITRHTCMPKFGSLKGLDSNKIRDGKLTEAEEIVFLKSLKDFETNPEYGYLNIIQMTRGASIKTAVEKIEEINNKVPLDYAVIDYISLMSALRNRSSRREEIEEMLQFAKEAAMTIGSGKGICMFAAHQTKQAAREKVKPEDDKFYTVRDFDHTSEAGKSIDVGIMLLRTPELADANEIAAKIVKSRDSDVPPMFKLFGRFESSYIGDLVV